MHGPGQRTRTCDSAKSCRFPHLRPGLSSSLWSGLVDEEHEIELLVLGPEPVHEESEQVRVDHLAEVMVLGGQPPELGGGQKAQLGMAQSLRGRRAGPVVDDAVLAEAAPGTEHVETHPARAAQVADGAL